MHIPGRTQEYERTCQDCGHAWRVPKWAVHLHLQKLPRGMGGVAAVGQTEAVAEANAEMAERTAVFRRCPKCESVHYKQRPS
jgi:hypothetical protein